MTWELIANLRGPAGFNATGAAEDDEAVAAFVAGPVSATRDALEAGFAQVGPTANPTFGRVNIGSSSPNERVPFKSSHGVIPSNDGTGNYVAHLLQSIVTGSDWDTPTSDDPNPGFFFGMNVFTTTGTDVGDADGMVSLYGALIEADVRAPTGTHIGSVIGLQAEAAFQTASADSTVDMMVSLLVANPVRKDGATSGVATTAYGLYVQKVAASDVGATTAYSIYAEGGDHRIVGASTLIADTVGADTFTVRAMASQTGALARFRDSGGGSVARVAANGAFFSSQRGVFNESGAEQTQIGTSGPLGESAVLFGLAGDTVLYRRTANVLAMGDNDTFMAARIATVSRPAAGTVGKGSMIYDSTLNIPIWSDGANWKNAAGVAV